MVRIEQTVFEVSLFIGADNNLLKVVEGNRARPLLSLLATALLALMFEMLEINSDYTVI